ncbi:MAG: hypothetical protein NZM11_05490, partial [Anaerolineales bacterium]|nr:hypothetical protein [Anaerolineales bacterium]
NGQSQQQPFQALCVLQARMSHVEAAGLIIAEPFCGVPAPSIFPQARARAAGWLEMIAGNSGEFLASPVVQVTVRWVSSLPSGSSGRVGHSGDVPVAHPALQSGCTNRVGQNDIGDSTAKTTISPRRRKAQRIRHLFSLAFFASSRFR